MNDNTTAILTAIAHEHLGVTTLEARRSDALDFHDLAVWQIQAALAAAYRAGAGARGGTPAGRTRSEGHGAQR